MTTIPFSKSGYNYVLIAVAYLSFKARQSYHRIGLITSHVLFPIFFHNLS